MTVDLRFDLDPTRVSCDCLLFLCMFLHIVSSLPSEGALEKSARAAGIPTKIAENYAASLVEKLPGNQCDDTNIFIRGCGATGRGIQPLTRLIN